MTSATLTSPLACELQQPAENKRVRKIGTLVLLFAVSILMEGVLRKWLLNPLQRPLYFVREPFLFAIYWYYLRSFVPNRRWLQPFLLYAFVVTAFSLAQNIYWQYPILVPFLAFRFFVLYIPLAFIMWDTLSERQLRRIIRMLLWVSVPIAVLVLIQFGTPVTSPINKGLTDEVEGRFTVVGDIVRPYGPFTFVLGQNNFAAMMFALNLVAYDQRKRFRLGALTLVAGGASALVMGALSGGRTYFVYLLLILLTYVAAGLTSGRLAIGVLRLVRVAFFALLFLLTFILIFPRAYESMSERQANATRTEGALVSRAFGILTGGGGEIQNAPIFGYGVAAGIPAARSAVGVSEGFTFGESESERFINEFGPVFGIPMLALRVWFVLLLAWLALRLNLKAGDGSAMIFLGYVAPMTATAQITMQNTMVGLGWFAVGLFLAMSRQGEEQHRTLGQTCK